MHPHQGTSFQVALDVSYFRSKNLYLTFVLMFFNFLAMNLILCSSSIGFDWTFLCKRIHVDLFWYGFKKSLVIQNLFSLVHWDGGMEEDKVHVYNPMNREDCDSIVGTFVQTLFSQPSCPSCRVGKWLLRRILRAQTFGPLAYISCLATKTLS